MEINRKFHVFFPNSCESWTCPMSILFSYQIRTPGHFGSSWGNQELSFAAGVRSSGLPSRIVPGGKTKKKLKTYFLCRWQKVTLPTEAERTQVFGSPRLTSMFQEQFPTRVHHRYHQDRLREILRWTFPKWVRWVWYGGGGYGGYGTNAVGMLSEILPGGFGGSGRGEDEAEDPPCWQRRLAEGSDPGETARGGHLPKHLPAGCNLLFWPKL